MITVNENFLKLQSGYLFPEISRRVAQFTADNPNAQIISLGIGDVTQPLPQAVIKAIKKAVDDLGTEAGFHGYGPERGYDFLIEAIIENDFRSRGVTLDSSEIFISDGAKCDTANIQEIFGTDNVIAVTDPVYPVYVESNVMAGRTGPANPAGQYEKIVYMPCTAANSFLPEPPDCDVDIIYLCFPNNPTGATASKEVLSKWVSYAKEKKAVILFDAAYEAFITESQIPHSIYEIDGAKDVAIEFRSFSKTAGFTGVRCAFTVVPRQVKAYARQKTEDRGQKTEDRGQKTEDRRQKTEDRGQKTEDRRQRTEDRSPTSDLRSVEVNALWNRRHSTKFNGASYISQAGAAAVYTPDGKKQVKRIISLYMSNAALIRKSLTKLGYEVYGGVNAPYIWLKTPDGMKSWDFFDLLLTKAHVVGTPGAGFGPSGEGYFRLTAFGHAHNVQEALNRLAVL